MYIYTLINSINRTGPPLKVGQVSSIIETRFKENQTSILRSPTRRRKQTNALIGDHRMNEKK